MAITDKTRKILWAKSGNKCAICSCSLVLNNTTEGNYIIGEECHIISESPSGPRHKCGLSNYDSYDNLLLLCRNHHKEIDDNVQTYSEDILRYMKTKHENRFAESTKQKQVEPQFIERIISGKELVRIIGSKHAYTYDYDENDSEVGIEYVSGVLQNIVDCGELYSDLEVYDKIKIDLELSNTLKELESKGYFLFGEKQRRNVSYGDGTTDIWNIATLIIRKSDDSEIIMKSKIE